MKIRNIVWLETVVDKIVSKHAVSPDEVEQVFQDLPQFRKMHRGRIQSEHVYRALGQTDEGRYLVVFFIHKRDHTALILSAREMDDKERKSYEES